MKMAREKGIIQGAVCTVVGLYLGDLYPLGERGAVVVFFILQHLSNFGFLRCDSLTEHFQEGTLEWYRNTYEWTLPTKEVRRVPVR